MIPLHKMSNLAETYKGTIIQPQPRELRVGGWKADFYLLELASVVTTNYEGDQTFPTREVAIEAALSSARRIIDQKFE